MMNYVDFIKKFVDKGYNFAKYGDDSYVNGQVIFRHDIDVDLKKALEMAIIEEKIQIYTTYFVLVTSPLYNPLTKENRQIIKEIKNIGHSIGLHFNQTIYNKPTYKIFEEVQILERIVGEQVKILSLHQSNDMSFIYDQKTDVRESKDVVNPKPFGIEITNSAKYSKMMKYFSDSNGIFKEDIFSSPEFKERKPLQVLTHPIWWMVEGTNFDVLKTLFEMKKKQLKTDLKESCLSKRKGYDENVWL